MLEQPKIIEQSEDIIAYDCGTVSYIRLRKWANVSDHTHEHQEVVFLMEGEVESIIWDEKQKIVAPIKVTIPPNTYHKFTALTNVIGLEIQ